MTILVTGATGNVGRHVVALLAAAGADVRALTRNPAAARFPAGVRVVAGDLARPDTVAPALVGVDRMYVFPLAYLAPVISSFEDVTTTERVVESAARAGVRRMVLLSSSDPDFRELERAVEAAAEQWTILRPGEFAVNKLDQWAPSIRADGVVRAAFPNSYGAPVHELDIADAAVAALLEDGHHGRRYELHGPRTLTLRQQVAAIAEGIGRDIGFEEVPPERYREQLIGQGIPAEVVDAHYLTPVVQPWTGPTVEQVTGRAGRTLTRWAADHAAEFRQPIATG